MREEDIVRKLREKLKNRVDNYLSDGYEGVALHTSSIVIALNEAAAKMFGYTVEEAEGLNAWILFHPDSAKIIMQHLVNKSEDSYRVQALKKDGSEFTVELKGKDFEMDGEPVRSVSIKEIKA